MAKKQVSSLLKEEHKTVMLDLARFSIGGGRVALFEDTSEPQSGFWTYGYLKLEGPAAKREEGPIFQVKKDPKERDRFLQMAREASEYYCSTVRAMRKGEAPSPAKKKKGA